MENRAVDPRCLLGAKNLSGCWIPGPVHFPIVKARFDGGFDHGEIGRNIEVTRSIKRGVANMENLLPRLLATRPLDAR